MTTIHDHITDRTELAKVYAEDGAFKRAAELLRELADKIDAHATECEAEMNAFMEAHKT